MIHLDWNAIPSCINPQGVPTLLCIPGLITNIIYWLLIFAGITALFLIIFSGFKFINSGGDSKAVDAARKTFTYALLGLILIFSSFAIVNLVGKTFGVQNILRFNFGPLNLTSDTQTKNKPTQWTGSDFNIKCNTKTQTTSCSAFGCKCVDIPKCKTPGAGQSECGAGNFCDIDKICRPIPSQPKYSCLKASTYAKIQKTWIPTTECYDMVKNTPADSDKRFCMPTQGYTKLVQKVGCVVPGTCSCQKQP